jgi:hypothetical protein
MRPEIPDVLPLPERFSTLAYLPDRRYRFFGGEHLYEAARRLPSVPFEIVGGKGSWVKKPLPNLRFHGWVGDMHSMYANASVIVRMARHDAIGAMVHEGLAYGRYVIYNYPLPQTYRVPFGDADGLTEAIRKYERLHAGGLLQPNREGRSYSLREFDEEKNTKALIDRLLNPELEPRTP